MRAFDGIAAPQGIHRARATTRRCADAGRRVPACRRAPDRRGRSVRPRPAAPDPSTGPPVRGAAAASSPRVRRKAARPRRRPHRADAAPPRARATSYTIGECLTYSLGIPKRLHLCHSQLYLTPIGRFAMASPIGLRNVFLNSVSTAAPREEDVVARPSRRHGEAERLHGRARP